jgi:hypothetical protein
MFLAPRGHRRGPGQQPRPSFPYYFLGDDDNDRDDNVDNLYTMIRLVPGTYFGTPCMLTLTKICTPMIIIHGCLCAMDLPSRHHRLSVVEYPI